MTVNWPKWNKLINERFVDLTNNTDRYLILYGGRGSSKSDFTSKLLIYRCLSHRYFKCILYRKNYNSIKESSYETLKQHIYDLGLEALFIFKINPLEIICVNGNRFMARGGDDPNKLKSIKDPSCVWYEEDIPNESDFATITLTIRGGKADLLQEIFTINPQVEGDHRDNWFWRRFFESDDALNFRKAIDVAVEGKTVTYNYTVHHSTYSDNRWLSQEVKAQIEDYKTKNPYLYSIYAKGLWTAKQTGGNFYKAFDRAKHTAPLKYNPDLPLHISFDFNVNPYCSCQVWQLAGQKAMLIDEIAATYPDNSTKGVSKQFMRRYFAHKSGVFVYGDPSGKSEDTRSERGQNDFRIIATELATLKPAFRIHSKAPAVVMRGNWINQILGHNEGGIEIIINDTCKHSIADYSYLKEASDGTKHKEKTRDPETGVNYEKYGHMSDCSDYLLTFAFITEYNNFQRGGVAIVPSFGRSRSKNSF
ncbi:XtmB Phage terminase large subunit [uncultured Caudovirales phage]|uniref:XtmB Phage terminase large subunit n=1 Tax=uncultured Caudovirales phage TaxID=2100421 RepID=A0A6J5PM39_9CAUD|nr:XtmB Phage terminase large subunit [uncultured Caudovirales phage]CAB4168704.1 XtmB Phage terminase large subunit [uncultured Caudovirales phage]